MAQQQQKQTEVQQQKSLEGGITGTSGVGGGASGEVGTTFNLAAGIGSGSGHAEKRKYRELLECDSDEDDFAGFDEDATNSENGVLSSPRSSNSLTTFSGAKKLFEQPDSLLSKVGSGNTEITKKYPMDIAGSGITATQGIFEPSGKQLSGAGVGGGGTLPGGGSAAKRKVVAPVNTQDDIFKLPFKYGWKRELVYRANLEGASKDKGEVYYITPAGKKLRTRNDIVMALHDGLTMDNFTFVKDPVGGSPDEEIIRSAKSYGAAPRRSLNSSSGSALDSPAVNEAQLGSSVGSGSGGGNLFSNNILGKRVPKPKMPKGASPPRSNSQTSPKSGAGGGNLASRNFSTTGGHKSNENVYNSSLSATTGKAATGKQPKSRSDEGKKISNSTSKNATPNSANNSRSFIADDLAAIRKRNNADSSNSRRSSQLPQQQQQQSLTTVASGIDQNRLFASNFFSNVSIGYDVLQQTFQYLKVQELLRASCVCRMWNQVANHPRLWRTVRMKNSHVNDWHGLASTLRKNGTKNLDLRKMLISGNSDEMWQSFITNISHADNLEHIDLCRCSSTVVGSLIKSNPNLKVINALAIKNDPIDLSNFEYGTSLQELRLKSSAAVSLEADLSPLEKLVNLRHLSLTSVLKLGSTSIQALSSLVQLESLELGECTEIGQNLADVLPHLTRLQRLRLEKGQEAFGMFTVLDAVAKLASLTQLELINCDVKVGFEAHIGACANIRKLLLIPTYVSQSAATNHQVLSGIIKLRNSLEAFVWTVTVELLRVTELYIDQCDTKSRDDKKSPGESIPILKPVPGHDESDSGGPSAASSSSSSTNPHETAVPIEIVPLATVNNILVRSLPKSRLKILKIPFANTWKQGMLEL